MLFADAVLGGRSVFRRRALFWGCAYACALMMMASWSVWAQKQAQASFSPQEMLDFLAKPVSAKDTMLKTTTFPSHFAEWTDEQKKVGLQQTVRFCQLAFSLEHDNPKARILPASMTMLEEAQLGMSVCLPTKMPADWPSRRKLLDTAQQLIAKAGSLGSTLHLPANLATKD